MCEGRVTEPKYLREFQHHVRNPRVHVEVAKETGVPLTVVQEALRLRTEAQMEAKRQRDEYLAWDQVWGVFDVDDHPNMEEALELAKREDIQVAVSNPCFELWALLHFQDQQASIPRNKLRQALKIYLPEYEKALDFSALQGAYDAAVARAQALERTALRLGEPGRNPSTGIFTLTETIRAPQ